MATRQITLRVPEEVYKQYQDASGEEDLSLSRYLRNSASVYTKLIEAVRQGKEIYIGNNGEVQKELIIPR